MQKSPIEFIEDGIEHFALFFDKKDDFAECALSFLAGKIVMAKQLEAITAEQAYGFLERLYVEMENKEEL